MTPDTPLTNTEILCYVLGWQGGSIHQVARAMNVETDEVLAADATRMRELCRMAQVVRRREGRAV